jgi:hypothetical protein
MTRISAQIPFALSIVTLPLWFPPLLIWLGWHAGGRDLIKACSGLLKGQSGPKRPGRVA